MNRINTTILVALAVAMCAWAAVVLHESYRNHERLYWAERYHDEVTNLSFGIANLASDYLQKQSDLAQDRDCASRKPVAGCPTDRDPFLDARRFVTRVIFGEYGDNFAGDETDKHRRWLLADLRKVEPGLSDDEYSKLIGYLGTARATYNKASERVEEARRNAQSYD